MKGLELSYKFFTECGEPVLKEQFPHILPYLAVGLAGSGSECYGYDDDISHDHDFEPAFCIFLPDEDVVDRKTAFQLERAYACLPKQFMGLTRSIMSPVGGSRHGVIRMDEFFLAKTGTTDGALSLEQWFSVPEYSLLEATNGAVFQDNLGQFTAIREKLRYFPESVRLKKLAGYLLLMGQAGQYNFSRCLSRGDTAAAQLAVLEFTNSALHVIYLLNRAYMPYYKWCFRGLKGLSVLSALAEDLEYLISSGNKEEEAKQKAETIERICARITNELKNQNLTALQTTEMERLAYAINDTITDHNIRNKHILYGV